MELTEAVQRILRHGRLILVMVVIFLSIPILLGSDSDASYVASARANFGPDVTTAEESEAMVDTAKAIVTSQAQVEDALNREGIDRDPKSPTYLRPSPDSPVATAGAGRYDPALPKYVGALPPKAWDWDRTWESLPKVSPPGKPK